MNIEKRSIDEVIPYARNPRANDAAVDAVAASIKEFGFRQPIVVDEAGVIVAGHTRFKAARRLGLDEVPVHVAQGLTEAQIKAYRLAESLTGFAGILIIGLCLVGEVTPWITAPLNFAVIEIFQS